VLSREAKPRLILYQQPNYLLAGGAFNTSQLSLKEKEMPHTREQRKTHYAKNRDAFLEKGRRYRADYKSEINEKGKKASRSFKGRHNSLKHALRRDNTSSEDKLWSVNFYIALIQGELCHYCFGPLCVTGGGLDRIDNRIGHTCFNVVPCCRQCNRIKGNDISYEEMMLLAPALRLIRATKVLV